MNGPDHYRAAESLLDMAEVEPEASLLTGEYLAAAQAHATLALAAATAIAAAALPADGETAQQWRQLVGVKRAPIEVPA